MISKKTFVSILKDIKDQEVIDENFGKSLETVCDSWCIYGTKNLKYRALFLLLKEIFNDEGEWITWWLYENVEKYVYYKNKKKKLIDTPEKLYDFLIKNNKKK
jgi:hypothetical protein